MEGFPDIPVVPEEDLAAELATLKGLRAEVDKRITKLQATNEYAWAMGALCEGGRSFSALKDIFDEVEDLCSWSKELKAQISELEVPIDDAEQLAA